MGSRDLLLRESAYHRHDRQRRALHRARCGSDQDRPGRLVKAGVLEQHTSGTLTVYLLTKDAQIREKIKHFVSASDDRQFRVKAIYHLIRGTR